MEIEELLSSTCAPFSGVVLITALSFFKEPLVQLVLVALFWPGILSNHVPSWLITWHTYVTSQKTFGVCMVS
jgi:hypothetical protein